MNNQRVIGTIEVSVTYACWALLSLFWNLLSDVNSFYVLAHRIFWSMVFMGLFILAAKKTAEIKALVRDKRNLALCFLCGILVSVNWGIYIYAVSSGYVLDVSLGNFIEPIVISILGMIAFKEKLSKWEKITFFCSLLSLIYLIITTRVFPLMAIVVAVSFAVYGAVKKKVPLSAHASLFIETLLIAPFALIFILWADIGEWNIFGTLRGSELLLLPVSGIVTSLPLLFFNIGVKKIPYYISGILMYINPTILFLMGIFIFREPMDIHRLIAFILIWIGIGFTVYEKIKLMKNDRNHPGSA